MYYLYSLLTGCVKSGVCIADNHTSREWHSRLKTSAHRVCGRDQMLIAPSAFSNTESGVIPRARSQGAVRSNGIPGFDFIPSSSNRRFPKKSALTSRSLALCFTPVFFFVRPVRLRCQEHSLAIECSVGG